jgi:hypothetical protein
LWQWDELLSVELNVQKPGEYGDYILLIASALHSELWQIACTTKAHPKTRFSTEMERYRKTAHCKPNREQFFQFRFQFFVAFKITIMIFNPLFNHAKDLQADSLLSIY